MNNLIFLDTETTGKDKDDRLLQVCYKLQYTDPITDLFKPPVPIKFEAMATHHITAAMVADKPAFAASPNYIALETLLNGSGKILVAHNAIFDIDMLGREGIKVEKFIDTLKVTQYLFDEPMYKLQYLRYRFDLDVSARAHDAEGDVIVLEALFNYLCTIRETKETAAGNHDDNFESCIKWMMKISQQPTLIRRIAFGKHRGRTFEDLAKTEKDYLLWLKKQPDIDEDLKYTLKYYLEDKQKALKI